MTWGVLLLAALWVAANLKTSRPDGTLRRDVHPYRRMMQFIMPTRNESVVYFDTYVRAENLEAYLAEARERFGANLTHALVAACNVGLGAEPNLNQFVAGRRLYRRDGRWITFSMKRERQNKRAKLSVVKLRMEDGETFRGLVERINAQINVERSGERTYADREFDLFLLAPRPVIRAAAAALRWLDGHNLLPASFIANDGMFTSMFIANLGSVGMGAGYHHLYEWGNCPLFGMAGQIEERAVVEDGVVVPRRILHLRFSFDERIEDGLTARHGVDAVVEVLEDPARWLGCLDGAGGDTVPMWPRQGT